MSYARTSFYNITTIPAQLPHTMLTCTPAYRLTNGGFQCLNSTANTLYCLLSTVFRRKTAMFQTQVRNAKQISAIKLNDVGDTIFMRLRQYWQGQGKAMQLRTRFRRDKAKAEVDSLRPRQGRMFNVWDRCKAVRNNMHFVLQYHHNCIVSAMLIYLISNDRIKDSLIMLQS